MSLSAFSLKPFSCSTLSAACVRRLGMPLGLPSDGKTVNYIVRVESGTINESIYRIAIIDDPANPITNPWSPGGRKPGPAAS
jgi:hypothetical protein